MSKSTQRQHREAQMLANLRMYKRPELVDAHNRYWALIRKYLSAVDIASPQFLSQDADNFETWTSPHLVLSQTCGMPYRNRLHGRVTLVGTPDFGLAGCLPGYYRSAIVVRKDAPGARLIDYKDALFSYNSTESQSGFAAPHAHAAPHGFWFQNRICMGQHLVAAQAVADGKAQIASIDAVSWRLMLAYEEFTDRLRVLEWTQSTPGLPYIAAANSDGPATFDAVKKAIADLSQQDREKLGLRDIVHIPAEVYLSVPNPS